jgi:hypothetical protein
VFGLNTVIAPLGIFFSFLYEGTLAWLLLRIHANKGRVYIVFLTASFFQAFGFFFLKKKKSNWTRANLTIEESVIFEWINSTTSLDAQNRQNWSSLISKQRKEIS